MLGIARGRGKATINVQGYLLVIQVVDMDEGTYTLNDDTSSRMVYTFFGSMSETMRRTSAKYSRMITTSWPSPSIFLTMLECLR